LSEHRASFRIFNQTHIEHIAKAIKKRADDLKSEGKREIDRQWLLAYQTWTETEMIGKDQPFLAELKKSNLNFICWDSILIPKELSL